jgi:hypothetical protein
MSGYRPLSDAEREEFAARRDREELDRLRRDQDRAEAAEAIRTEAMAVIDRYNRPGAPKDITVDHLLRAYRRDIVGAPGGCESAGQSGHTHRPGSMGSVAHRLGVSETGLYDARRRLAMAGACQREWPPTR